MPLIIFRSALFHVLFYIHCTFWFLFAILAWPFPSRAMMAVARFWAAGSIYLHELATGARVEVRGMENIPSHSALVAAKHQSAWETMALLLFFPKATYIFKRELLWVPLFGWHLLKAEQVPIDRGDRNKAMASITRGVRLAVERARQVVIFPEGTRRKVGAKPAYRFGVARIYGATSIPCLPVAMTSGLAWPRNTLLHFPRRILVEFLPTIPPNLESSEFHLRMQDAIETGTNRLLIEAGFDASKIQQADNQRESAGRSQDSA